MGIYSTIYTTEIQHIPITRVHVKCGTFHGLPTIMFQGSAAWLPTFPNVLACLLGVMMWKPDLGWCENLQGRETLVTRTKNSDWLVWSLQLPMKPIQICMIFPHTNTATKVLVTAPYTFLRQSHQIDDFMYPHPRKWTNGYARTLHTNPSFFQLFYLSSCLWERTGVALPVIKGGPSQPRAKVGGLLFFTNWPGEVYLALSLPRVGGLGVKNYGGKCEELWSKNGHICSQSSSTSTLASRCYARSG